MWSFFKKKIPHPDFPEGTFQNAPFYTGGIVFDGGAERLAFRQSQPHPLQERLQGILAGQLPVTEPQNVYQLKSASMQPLIAGVTAGQIIFQPLTDADFQQKPVQR